MSTTLAIKYRPTTFEDVVGQSSTKAILENQLVTNTIKNAYLFCGSAGTGKAQPLYSKVLTPSGFVSMGDIMVGDEVFTHSGRITQVTAVYPQGKRDIYEITLQDRTCIRVADNHLNSVYRYNRRKKCREDYVLTTLDLIKFMNKSKYKLRVDVPKVDWDEKPVLINPYLLGILIGDGSLSNNLSLSNVESDIIYKADMILHKEYNMKLTSQNNKDYKICYITNPKHNGSKGDRGLHKLVRNYNPIETLKGQLASYGLLCKSTEKHIPKEYLLNSESIRLALLQGLFDTDGFTEKNGCTSFTTSSKQLSDDFEFLVRSLGIRDTVSSAPSSYIKGGIKHTRTTHYTHYLHMPKNLKYCTSKKHLSRYKNRQNEPIRNIESIRYIGKEFCQCIMVEDDDHTYISDSFIPTHNTTCARIFANEINKHNGIPIEIDAASHSSVNDVREIVNQAQTKSIDGEYKIFIIDEAHSISNTGWQAFLKLLEEPPAKTIFIFATTDPQKIPKTILSRVQRYNFQRISNKDIYDRLVKIIDEESDGISYEDEALSYITKLANGGMRDAITMLDKCISYNNHLTLNSVVEALNKTNPQTMVELCEALLGGEKRDIIEIIEEVHNSGADLKIFVKEFTDFLLDVCKYMLTNSFEYTIYLSEYNKNWLNSITSSFDLITSFLDKMTKLNSDIKYSDNPKYAVEATLILLGGE